MQNLSDNWRRLWIVGESFRGESQLVEHVSGVGIASRRVTQSQEVIIDERRHKSSFSTANDNLSIDASDWDEIYDEA